MRAMELVEGRRGIADRVIALTFDDGPSPWTEPIAERIERHGGRGTFFAIGEEVDRLGRMWPPFLAGLPVVELARSVAYVNSKGEEWTTSVEDILLHVVFHSGYHRGQVAYVLRAGGAIPAYTDYVHCVRNGLL